MNKSFSIVASLKDSTQRSIKSRRMVDKELIARKLILSFDDIDPSDVVEISYVLCVECDTDKHYKTLYSIYKNEHYVHDYLSMMGKELTLLKSTFEGETDVSILMGEDVQNEINDNVEVGADFSILGTIHL